MTANVKHLVVVMALGCAVAGCQSHPANQSAPASSGSASPQSAKPIDACAMLSPQDISGVLGVTVQGKSTGKDPQMGDCSWRTRRRWNRYPFRSAIPVPRGTISCLRRKLVSPTRQSPDPTACV